jgi:hypothetical protein
MKYCMVPIMFLLSILFVWASVDVANYWKFSLVLITFYESFKYSFL